MKSLKEGKIYIEIELHKKLKKIAIDEGCSLKELVNSILERAVKNKVVK